MFIDRLHQLPATVAEVDDFVAEGKTFASDLMPNILEQLEKEARLQKFRLSNDESYRSAILKGGPTRRAVRKT